MPFLAFDLSIELVTSLREPLAAIHKRNASLAKQLDRAADSISLNLAESGGRFGADRLQHYRIAYGSLREVHCALQLAVAKGWLTGNEPVHSQSDRLGGMLYRLAAPR